MLAIIIVVSVVFVGVLSAGGIAVRSVSRIWLRHWVERGLPGAALAASYLERPQRLIVSAGAGIALTVFLAGVAVARLDGPPLVLTGRLVGLCVALLLLGQIVPRALARRWPVRLVPAVVPVLRGVDAGLTPLRLVGRTLARPFGGAPRHAEPPDVRDSLESLLREGQLEGVGETQELAIISGVVQFGEKRAREVMTARDDVFALDLALPPRELAARLAQSGYSRIVVYRGSLDHVAGIVHAFDVLTTGGEAYPPILPVQPAGAETPCNELLFAMLRTRRHLAVVQDEAGRTLGLVTLEDLLEELVGDIRDEHDEPAPAEPPVG